LSPGGTEKPRREEAIMTSKGSGTRRTKEKGDQRGQANDMGWFSAMMRGRSAHTRAALSPMMILVALSQYTPVLCGTPRTNVISKMSGGRTYATPYGERFLHLAQVKGKSRKHHLHQVLTTLSCPLTRGSHASWPIKRLRTSGRLITRNGLTFRIHVARYQRITQKS
jgi:hypothetical protein